MWKKGRGKGGIDREHSGLWESEESPDVVDFITLPSHGACCGGYYCFEIQRQQIKNFEWNPRCVVLWQCHAQANIVIGSR